ncbi:hypothetical protein, partial [Mesorhizobium sp.]|uniref:hypothetical protein n=1 Tax=Mesorhizobium sp. TaxID=1871066 RepID=UPI0025DBDFFA
PIYQLDTGRQVKGSANARKRMRRRIKNLKRLPRSNPADPFAQGRFRATYAKRAATRLALLFYACRYLKTAAHF